MFTIIAIGKIVCGILFIVFGVNLEFKWSKGRGLIPLPSY